MKVTQILPQQAYNAKQVREHEAQVAKQLEISMYQLMERAGAASYQLLTEQQINQGAKQGKKPSSILVVCGKGNNGGDGFVVARLAKQAGLTVVVLLLCAQTHVKGDALIAMQSYLAVQGEIHSISDTCEVAKQIKNFTGDIIIDAMLGTGFSGQLKPVFHRAINAINHHQVPVLSLDIPSGLTADTGFTAQTAVNATVTVTFIAPKKGLLTGQAANHIGKLYFAGLAVDNHFNAVVKSDVFVLNQASKPQLSSRKPASHKGDIGLLLAIGGGQGMPGAIRLASEAALRTGAALVSVCCEQHNQAVVVNGRPELMLAPNNADLLNAARVLNKAKTVLIGPGLGRSEWAKKLFNVVVSKQAKLKKTLIVDADALYFLAQQPFIDNNRVITPHPKEAAMLLNCSVNDIEADRFAAVEKLAQKYGGICLLKGAGSLISNGQQTWINTSGNAGMASGGMGDVLSGIIAALSMQLPDLFTAVKLAVYLHGYVADVVAQKQGQIGMLASDLFLPLQQSINCKCEY
jgi:ADP-dependent NAD(P)H-hydrate dehydratase / NAD(P)H-hydrate epimerase